MRVIRRFLYPLPRMPGWCAIYDLVEEQGMQRLHWSGIARRVERPG